MYELDRTDPFRINRLTVQVVPNKQSNETRDQNSSDVKADDSNQIPLNQTESAAE